MTQWNSKTIPCFGILLFSLGLLFSFSSAQEVTATEVPPPLEEPKKNTTEKPKPVLTGDPQKDYIHDPNLPYELKGYDLSDYPFYKRVPNVEFNFTCDNRHDGFYASIPHKCQVYHNCLFGVRYDFLCANYTAFDQSNFICHWANEVDCPNSEDYFFRNDALYKEETTTTTTVAPQIKIIYIERQQNRRRRLGNKKGAPLRRTTPKPADDYYYDDYQDETITSDYYYDDVSQNGTDTANSTTTTTTTTTTTRRPPPPRRRPLKTRLGAQSNQNNRPRVQRPQNVQDVDYDLGRQTGPRDQQQQQNQKRPMRKRRRRRKKTTTTTTTTAEPEYYDEYYDYEYYDDVEPTTTTTTKRPAIRRQGQGQRLSPQARRKALLQSRNSQLQKPQPSSRNQPTSAPDVVYDDPTFAENAPAAVVEDVPLDYEESPPINARRPGAFKRPRNRRLSSQTP